MGLAIGARGKNINECRRIPGIIALDLEEEACHFKYIKIYALTSICVVVYIFAGRKLFTYRHFIYCIIKKQVSIYKWVSPR